jgi:hypothetical protein
LFTNIDFSLPPPEPEPLDTSEWTHARWEGSSGATEWVAAQAQECSRLLLKVEGVFPANLYTTILTLVDEASTRSEPWRSFPIRDIKSVTTNQAKALEWLSNHHDVDQVLYVLAAAHLRIVLKHPYTTILIVDYLGSYEGRDMVDQYMKEIVYADRTGFLQPRMLFSRGSLSYKPERYFDERQVF